MDPDTKAPILDKDGKIVTEEKEIEIPMFRPVKVFDVSQTDGKPLPELASSLSGNVPNYEAFMEALRRSALVPITFEAMAADTDGYFSADHQKIAIRQGMSEVQTVSATVTRLPTASSTIRKRFRLPMTSNIRRSSCLINPVYSPMGGLSVIICRRAFIAMTCAVLTTTPESRSV